MKPKERTERTERTEQIREALEDWLANLKEQNKDLKRRINNNDIASEYCVKQTEQIINNNNLMLDQMELESQELYNLLLLNESFLEKYHNLAENLK